MACTTCTTCGSSAPCACGSGSLSTCNQVGVTGCCGSSSAAISSCCSNVVQATPLPYYSCAPACPEDHTQKIVINKFAADIKITSSWNVPVCGESAIVTVPGLTAIAIGSYIWNAEFGYFEVTAFNAGTQQITIANRCTDGNAAAGTNVPACTEFIVTDPPVDISTQSGACVAVDFTAPPACPAVGCCINITLTTVTGIISGGIVQIGTGFYTVDAVLPNDIITICNNGDGILPGTSVIALDASGNYQYCLTILSSNPCDNEEVEEGTLIVCAEQAIHPVVGEGIKPGYIVAATLEDTANVALVPPPMTDACTAITVEVAIVNATASYNIQVLDSSLFTVGDFLVAGAQAGTFEVTSLPDSTHVVGTFDPVPSANSTIAVGSSLCLANCCAEVADILQNNTKTLIKTGVQSTVVNSALETAIFQYTIPAGTLNTNSLLRYSLHLTCLNNTGGNEIITFRINLGATNLMVDPSTMTTSASRRGYFIRFELMNNNSLSVQSLKYERIVEIQTSANAAFGATVLAGFGTATENTAGALAIQVSAQLSAASPDLLFTKVFNYLEII